LRNRQLPDRVVPVVPPRANHPRTPAPSPEEHLGFFGTVRKKLSDLFSAISLNTTSYDQVTMEETFIGEGGPLTSTPQDEAQDVPRPAPRIRKTPPPALPMTRVERPVLVPRSDARTPIPRSDARTPMPVVFERDDDVQYDEPLPRLSRPVPRFCSKAKLEQPEATPDMPEPVINNYHNCSFGSTGAPDQRRRPNLPKFDETKVDIEAYFSNFEAIMKGWSDGEKVAALRERLEGGAAKVLAHMDLQGCEVDYQSLKDALERHYVGERSHWMTKLRDAHRETGESLDDLAFRISLYSKRAYGALQTDLGLQFYLALRESPLGDRLYQYKDRPLDEILHQAKSYENHLISTNQPVLNRSQPAAVAAVSANFEATGGYSDSSMNDRAGGRGGRRGGRWAGRGMQRYSSQDRRLDNNEKKCYLCRRSDHLWRECSYARKHFSSEFGNASSSPDSNDTLNH